MQRIKLIEDVLNQIGIRLEEDSNLYHFAGNLDGCYIRGYILGEVVFYYEDGCSDMYQSLAVDTVLQILYGEW